MTKIQSPFEFDQSNELHRKAQHYLETMDREVFPTFGDVMVAAIVDYFDRYYGSEMSEVEEVFDGVSAEDLDRRIERAVERALDKKLPQILSEILEKGETVVEDGESVSEESEEEGEDDQVDLSSVADAISWGFLNG